MLQSEIKIIYIINKSLPENDYRIHYAAISKVCKIEFGMPGKTSTLSDQHYHYMRFGESIKVTDIFHYWTLFWFLFRNRSKYNAVHFFSTSLVLFGPIVAWFARMPSLITITGFGRTFTGAHWIYPFFRPIYHFLLRIAVSLSLTVFFQNRQDKDMVGNYFPKHANKLVFGGSAVSASRLIRDDYETETIQVLLVARLLPDKGIYDFLRISQLMSGKGFRFVLVGPSSVGNEKVVLDVRQSAEMGEIQYLGELSATSIVKIYAQSQVLFFPSYGEGMSRVMLEAGFAGLCPIAYEIAANNELLSEGRGFKLKVGEIDNVKRVLSLLYGNRQLLRRNALAYQEFITKNFTIEEYAKRIDRQMVRLFRPGLQEPNN